MPKYFKVTVGLHHRVELEIEAFDESAAKEKAKEMALRQHPRADVASVAVGQIAECEICAGSGVTHRLFGPGEVLVVCRDSGALGAVGFVARVQFGKGVIRNLRLPNPHLSLTADG